MPWWRVGLFFKKIIYLYLFLVVLGLLSIHRLSLVAVSGGYSLIAMHRLLIMVVSLFAKHKLQSIGSVVVAHKLSCSVVYASSQTRGWTCVPCNGRWIFIHHTPREVQLRVFLRVSTQKNEVFSEWKWNGGCVCQNCRNLLSSSGDLLRVLSRLPVLCLHYISRGARPLNKGSQWWSATK